MVVLLVAVLVFDSAGMLDVSAVAYLAVLMAFEMVVGRVVETAVSRVVK